MQYGDDATRDEVIDAMARAFFVSRWAEEMEEQCPGDISAGSELMDIAPETPPEALEHAKKYAREFELANSTHIPQYFEMFERQDVPTPDADTFGHYVAMEALGSGVSLADDYTEARELIDVIPHSEFYDVVVECEDADEEYEDNGHRGNPQETFNPIDYNFRWTDDWYEWDAEAAKKAARRARDARAKELQQELGIKPKKFTVRDQLVRRGGIGSGHPDIEHWVNVYALDYRGQGYDSNGAPSGPRSGFGREKSREDIEARIAWERWAAAEQRRGGSEALAQGHDLARVRYEELLESRHGFVDNPRGPGGRFESHGRSRMRATLPAGWSTTAEGEANWEPMPEHEYRISKQGGRWALTYFAPGARTGEWIEVREVEPRFGNQLAPEVRGDPTGRALFVHSFHAADAAQAHWDEQARPSAQRNPRRRQPAPTRGVIGAAGIEAPRSIRLQPETMYYMGASSSPESIVITRLTDDRIYYRPYPYQGPDRQIQRWIGADLIARGTATWLASGYAARFPEEAENLSNLVTGQPGEQVEIRKLERDYQRVRVGVVAAGRTGKDLWREAERYGNVGGIEMAEGGYLYEIEGPRVQVEGVLTDPQFEVAQQLRATERGGHSPNQAEGLQVVRPRFENEWLPGMHGPSVVLYFDGNRVTIGAGQTDLVTVVRDPRSPDAVWVISQNSGAGYLGIEEHDLTREQGAEEEEGDTKVAEAFFDRDYEFQDTFGTDDPFDLGWAEQFAVMQNYLGD